MADTGVSYCPIGREGVIHDPATGRLLVLNGTARIVWEMTREGMSGIETAQALCAQFGGVDLARAQADVQACLDELAHLGLGDGSRIQESGQGAD
jgi:hypothetical protein